MAEEALCADGESYVIATSKWSGTAGGNRTGKDNLVNSAFDESYSYDDLGRLLDFARGSHTQEWDLDALGNMNEITTDGGTPETRSHE